MAYKVEWTNQAEIDLIEILDHLKLKWTQKEVVNFKSKLKHQIELIKQNPNLFPKSEIKQDLKKAVLSPQTIIFYKVSKQTIYIVHLFVTKKSPRRIK